MENTNKESNALAKLKNELKRSLDLQMQGTSYPSEMTNVQIAEELLATIPRLSDEAWASTDADEILREAAKRLLMEGDDDISKDAELEELREYLKEACDVACDGCRLAVWNDGKVVKCKKHKNWKCPFGTERWRKALEWGNDGTAR